MPLEMMPSAGRNLFVAAAIRDAERRLGIPAGWWGTYRDVHGPGGWRVRNSGSGWFLSRNGKRVSGHDSRSFAISKARKLASAALREAPK